MDNDKSGNSPCKNSRRRFFGQASRGGLRVPAAREIPGGRVRMSRKREQRTRPPGIQPEDPAHRNPANFILCITVYHWFSAFRSQRRF